jgi:histidinol dehydrogenase
MTPVALEIYEWRQLPEAERARLLARPGVHRTEARLDRTREIIQQVRKSGDRALFALTAELDGIELTALQVGVQEVTDAIGSVAPDDRAAIDAAILNVRRFHEAQHVKPLTLETAPGVTCELLQLPIDSVGLYVPAGVAPLPSTAIMLAEPARIAGCRLRLLCTPPRPDGKADPAIVYAAWRCGIHRIYKVGGAQAIAAMAYGTASVPRVHKVFGPGNVWVSTAKQLVAMDPEGVACDLPAGPSEVLVIADQSARPEFVAADLLAQAEHGADAQVLLVSTSRALLTGVNAELIRQLATRRRADTIAAALNAGRAFHVPTLPMAFEVANRYAPEHLILAIERARAWLHQVTAAGSVFLGHWAPEVLGDYCSGTNHVLPTGGFARSRGVLSLADFTRPMAVQEATRAGLAGLGPVAERLALLEGLDAHAEAIAIRLRLERGVAA